MGYAAPGTGNKDTYPHKIISTPFVGEPGSISSETYLCVCPFDSSQCWNGFSEGMAKMNSTPLQASLFEEDYLLRELGQVAVSAEIPLLP